jgi:hypothetical protein
MDEAGDVTVLRFRHTLGDIGPLEFDNSTGVQSVKETLFSQWPTGGWGSQGRALGATPRPQWPCLHWWQLARGVVSRQHTTRTCCCVGRAHHTTRVSAAASAAVVCVCAAMCALDERVCGCAGGHNNCMAACCPACRGAAVKGVALLAS